jgi:transposase
MWGAQLLWGRLWSETFAPILTDAGLSDRQSTAVYLMVLHRLVDPGSKCAAFRFAGDVYGAPFEGLGLHDLYRALDELAEAKEVVEKGWYARHRDLFTEADLLYFDTTTTYVEGSRPEELAAFGYSRDHRSDRRQVGLGVVMTRGGLPVAHVILPGNTADPSAFRSAIEYLRETLGVGRVMLCCDRGMVLEETLQALRDAGMPYLAATKLRRAKTAQAVLSQPGRYQVVADNLEVKEVDLAEVEDRYIVCRNPAAVEADRQEREAIVEMLAVKLATGSVKGLLRGAARRYVRMQGGRAALDRGKIEDEARYDGKWVLRTNSDLSAAEAALAYKGLWQVEDAFRTLKTPLELRPIYHWTEKRVRGHITICFLAFTLRQILKKRLAQQSFNGSFIELVEGLSRVRAVVLDDGNGRRYRLRDEIPAASMPAFRALKIVPPRRVERLD